VLDNPSVLSFDQHQPNFAMESEALSLQLPKDGPAGSGFTKMQDTAPQMAAKEVCFYIIRVRILVTV
jgi:hypothetical protein